MRVNVAFEFSEAQLRIIRATFGRGGVATRKDSRLFINQAVAAAFRVAPEPKPKRTARPAPEPPKAAPLVCECGDDEDAPLCAMHRAKRDQILGRGGKPLKALRGAL